MAGGAIWRIVCTSEKNAGYAPGNFLITVGAVTHIMVKGLSRGKVGVVFTRVNFTQVTCGYTYTYLPRLISVSTQLFSLETLEGLSERAGFSVLKTLDIQDKKNVTWMF